MYDVVEYTGQKPVYEGKEVEMPDMNFKALWDVQNCELVILCELERICQKYGLHYSLTGGTLIGAVRHHDFVPWDDDIDIDMPEDDYQKLLKLLPTELGEDFEFVNYSEYGNYFCDFIPRIFYKKSKTVNSFSLDGTSDNMTKDDRMNRVFIEIYRIYDTKKGLINKIQLFNTRTIYGLCMGHRAQQKSEKNYSTFEKISSEALKSVGKFIPLKALYFLYEKNASFIKSGKGDAFFKPCVPLHVLERNVFEKSWFDFYTHLEVRDKQVMVPGNYKAMLDSLYDNWRELPPVKDRHPDHFNLDKVEIWK